MSEKTIEKIKKQFAMFVPNDDGSAKDWFDNVIEQIIEIEREKLVQKNEDSEEEITALYKFAHAIREKVIHECVEALPETKQYLHRWSDLVEVWNECLEQSKQSLLNLLSKE